MGCVSSKHYRKDVKQSTRFDNGDHHSTHHVVSLTSSTYGLLQLDKQEQPQAKTSPPHRGGGEDQPEIFIINAKELMKDLEEEIPISVPSKKSPKSRLSLHGFADSDTRRRSPLKLFNQMGFSPRSKTSKFEGKENKGRVIGPNSKIFNSPRTSTTSGPLFDPELVSFFEKKLSEEEEQIKRMVSATPISRKLRNFEPILEEFEEKCPPGGKNRVVMYTTTLRGIRKTFEECNIARSIMGSHGIEVIERDVSMDSGFREELRGLMGTKEVKVPLVFVKGRLIGGAEEVVRLEEEGRLGRLLEGVPKAVGGGCEGCAGVRFVLCMECSGSCKVLGEDGRKTVRCGGCNENGLIYCPICC